MTTVSDLMREAADAIKEGVETTMHNGGLTEKAKDRIKGAIENLWDNLPKPRVTDLELDDDDPSMVHVTVEFPVEQIVAVAMLNRDPIQEHCDRMKKNSFLKEGDLLDPDYLRDLEFLGTFEVETDELIISDPCYDQGTWCMGALSPVKTGTWLALVQRGDYVGWGERICKLVAVHQDHPIGDAPEFRMSPIDVGVDSGQAGIFDERYYKNDEAIDDEDKGDYPWDCDGEFYSACGSHTLSKKGAGCLKHGAVASSGVGDGSYNCYAAAVDGLIVGVALDFLVGPEHAGEWEDEDDGE